MWLLDARRYVIYLKFMYSRAGPGGFEVVGVRAGPGSGSGRARAQARARPGLGPTYIYVEPSESKFSKFWMIPYNCVPTFWLSGLHCDT